MGKSNCDSCVYYTWDEDEEYYYCAINLDEDDMARFMMGNTEQCAYYQLDDEYAVVRKQN